MAIPEMRALALAGPRGSQTQFNQFRDTRVEFRVLFFPSPEEVAQALTSERPDVALIFGGDGTVNRHLNQLAMQGIPLLAVPCGSGNDLARAVGMPNLQAALLVWQQFLDGNCKFVSADLGRIHSDRLSAPRYFSCCANIGLDADAARRTDHLPNWMKSHGGYFIGGLLALMHYQPVHMTISGGGQQFAESGWFVSISNTPTYGGGLKIAPQASISDGHLDVTFASSDRFSRRSLACHFPKIFSGRHLAVPELKIFTSRTLHVESACPLPVYADGEYITETACDIEIVPGTLHLLTALVL